MNTVLEAATRCLFSIPQNDEKEGEVSATEARRTYL